MAIFKVKDLYKKHREELDLKLVVSNDGMEIALQPAWIGRPGLNLIFFSRKYLKNKIMLFGTIEMEYLEQLSSEERLQCLRRVLDGFTLFAVVASDCQPLPEMIELLKEKGRVLFTSSFSTSDLQGKLMSILTDEFAPSVVLHGTLVEVYGMGVLLQGSSSIGKSEIALGLVKKGHRLISDDMVHIKLKNDGILIGSAPEIAKNIMEIRGIGIIDVALLYGVCCVEKEKKIDIVIELQEWESAKTYDRIGIEEQFYEILEVKVPYHILPVRAGRSVAFLVETIALNMRLKGMGYNTAFEFRKKLRKKISENEEMLKDETCLEKKF